MAGTLRLEVVTPEELKYEGEASIVQLPGYMGEMGILPQHAPLVTMLKPGELMYRNSEGTFHMAVDEGFATIADNKVVCLVDAALRPKQIKTDDVTKRLAESEGALRETQDKTPTNPLRKRVDWYRVQLQVAERSQ